MNTRRDADAIEAQAARWVVRFDREGESPALKAELEQWLQHDDRHRGAMLKAEATWLLLDSVRPTLSAPSAVFERPSGGLFKRGGAGRRVVGGLAASLAAGLATVAFLSMGGDHYKTGVGEVRRVALADRSTVAINTASDVAVIYERQQRRISIQEGEVWFQVAKDKTRPFIVEAGSVRVEALGTAFSVRRRPGGADILVTEGVVKAWVTGLEGDATWIEAGSYAFVRDNTAITKAVARTSELDRQLAWRAGKIDLAGETLAEAVSEFNRYNVRQIIVADEAAREKRLHGVFRIDDPEGFARAASISLGVRSSVTSEGNIALSSAR